MNYDLKKVIFITYQNYHLLSDYDTLINITNQADTATD